MTALTRRALLVALLVIACAFPAQAGVEDVKRRVCEAFVGSLYGGEHRARARALRDELIAQGLGWALIQGTTRGLLIVQRYSRDLARGESVEPLHARVGQCADPVAGEDAPPGTDV